jgi:hypothetical protein
MWATRKDLSDMLARQPTIETPTRYEDSKFFEVFLSLCRHAVANQPRCRVPFLPSRYTLRNRYKQTGFSVCLSIL